MKDVEDWGFSLSRVLDSLMWLIPISIILVIAWFLWELGHVGA